MGDDQDRARIVRRWPSSQAVVSASRWLVGSSSSSSSGCEQQLAERDAAALAAGELGDVPIVGRAAQRVHRLVDLAVEIPEALASISSCSLVISSAVSSE
jgi:hypothetical protein